MPKKSAWLWFLRVICNYLLFDNVAVGAMCGVGDGFKYSL